MEIKYRDISLTGISAKFQVIVNFTEIPVNEISQYFINWNFCKLPGNTWNFIEIQVNEIPEFL